MEQYLKKTYYFKNSIPYQLKSLLRMESQY